MPWHRHVPQCFGVDPNIVPTTVVMQLASMITTMFLKIAAFHPIVPILPMNSLRVIYCQRAQESGKPLTLLET